MSSLAKELLVFTIFPIELSNPCNYNYTAVDIITINFNLFPFLRLAWQVKNGNENISGELLFRMGSGDEDDKVVCIPLWGYPSDRI